MSKKSNRISPLPEVRFSFSMLEAQVMCVLNDYSTHAPYVLDKLYMHTAREDFLKIFRLKIQKFISNNHVWERHHHLVAYAKFFLVSKKTSGHDQWSVTLLDKYFQMVTVQVCRGFIY